MRALAFLVTLVLATGSMHVAASANDDGGNSEPSISFPGVCLRKGMAKAEALRKLTGLYEVIRLDESQAREPGPSNEEESYLLKDKIDPASTVGVVTFADRKLLWASRAWGSASDQKTADLAGQIYSLIEQITKERGVVASLRTQHSLQRNLAVDQVKILIGGKEALITIMKEKDSNGSWTTQEVHVDEALREE